MPTRERIRTAGVRIGGSLVIGAGREIRHLRRAAGVSQAQLAAAAGTSRQRLCRFELGRARDIQLVVLASLYAAVGHRLTFKAFPVGDAVRDAAQYRLLARFEARLSPAWRRVREAVMPIPGDMRAWDLLLRGPVSIGVEAVTALADLQALERMIEAKQRDSGVQFVVLLVSDTHRNRQIVAAHRASLRQRFPLSTREVLAALSAGQSPRGNGLVLL